MRRALLLIISYTLAWPLMSQVDSTMLETDSVVVTTSAAEMSQIDTAAIEKPVFFQSSLNIDYGKAGTTLAGFDEKYEAGVTLLFYNQYYLLGEYGMSTLSPENAFRNGSYTSEGTYFRIGGGVLKQLDLRSKMGLGVLYGVSEFKDGGAIFISSPSEVQGDYNNSFERGGLSARWIEFMLTSESRVILNSDKPEAFINHLISLGFYLRARFLSTYDRFTPVDVYTIPGYGRTVNNPNLALNLYLKIHLF